MVLEQIDLSDDDVLIILLSLGAQGAFMLFPPPLDSFDLCCIPLTCTVSLTNQVLDGMLIVGHMQLYSFDQVGMSSSGSR